MMVRTDYQAWAHCERLTRQFYRSLDRHETEVIEAMLADDCQWVRGGRPYVGPMAIREQLMARPKDTKTLHLVGNEVANETPDGDIEVNFDLLYVSNDPANASAGDGGATTPKVLSGKDRYRFSAGQWRLAHKEATLKF